MAPRPSWWHKLQGSRQEALLAVDLYNRAGEDRRLEAFIVHVQIAWLYLIHAKFDREGTDYWYRDDRGRRIKVEGDFKCWELARCIKEVFPNQEHPVRRNVEFFIGFRNKIEHRYEKLLLSDDLQSARTKLARANVHTRIAKREAVRFFNRHPDPTFRFEPEGDEEPSYEVGSVVACRLVVATAPPDLPASFAARFGDAIQLPLCPRSRRLAVGSSRFAMAPAI